MCVTFFFIIRPTVLSIIIYLFVLKCILYFIILLGYIIGSGGYIIIGLYIAYNIYNLPIIFYNIKKWRIFQN
jgi:hypothetical protein